MRPLGSTGDRATRHFRRCSSTSRAVRSLMAVPSVHPDGADTRLLHAMRREGLRRGMVTLCIGGGQGIALAVKSVS